MSKIKTGNENNRRFTDEVQEKRLISSKIHRFLASKLTANNGKQQTVEMIVIMDSECDSNAITEVMYKIVK